MRVETEEKFYCLDSKRIVELAERLNFKKIIEKEDIDEYFTDINGNFIKNRTCLRLRKADNKRMEVTYKGKSDSLLGRFCKLENSISVDINDYDKYIKLFSSLGYYSYVEVVKRRMVYQYIEKNYKYNIMIDSLPEIGGFVEFEIVSEHGRTNKEEMKKELTLFIKKFEELKLKEATRPYRDIVAKHIHDKILNRKKIENICINLDCELSRYEKEFYKKYKDKISKLCGTNIKWGEYKRNLEVDSKIIKLVDKFLDNLIFDSNELLVSIELLKKIPYKKYFITKVNSLFFERFFNKLNVDIENVIYLKTGDKVVNILNKNNISFRNSIMINDSDFKVNNSNLLILINES